MIEGPVLLAGRSWAADKEGYMRCAFRAGWESLYVRVLDGDPMALVSLRNQAISLVARCRVARYSPIPPWLREDLAEKAFDSTGVHSIQVHPRRFYGVVPAPQH